MRVRLMQSDRLAAVGELVAGVAHEVNNPLSSISAFAQILLRDERPHGDAARVHRGDQRRKRCARAQVVKDLLAFARRSEPLRAPLDLNTVVRARCGCAAISSAPNHIARRIGARRGVAVGRGRRAAASAGLPQPDDERHSGDVAAAAAGALVSTRADGDRVVFEMSDTGPGIPESVRAHIFEPFFTTKDEGEGTGLGLSVSYGIVTAHGGWIEVANTSASGTTFRVTLPAGSGAPENGSEGTGEAATDGSRIPVS